MGIALGLGLGLPFSGDQGWTPAALGSTLLGWWDAERADLITQSGGAVSSWKDVVAGYNVTQSTGSQRPVVSATSYNNRPGVTFDGVDDYLELTASVFPTGSTPCEMWALVDQTALAADTTTRVAFAYGVGASAVNSRRMNRLVPSGVNRAATGVGDNTTVVNNTNNAVDFSGRHVMRSVVSAVDVNTIMDGTAAGASAVVPSTSGAVTRIGAASHALLGFWQGAVNSVIVTSPLATDQAAQLTTYLKARGGIP